MESLGFSRTLRSQKVIVFLIRLFAKVYPFERRRDEQDWIKDGEDMANSLRSVKRVRGLSFAPLSSLAPQLPIQKGMKPVVASRKQTVDCF